MAKTILSAELHLKDGTNYVRCVVEMPASEYAAFIGTGTLTDAVPSKVTTHINNRNNAGPKSGQ